MPGQVPQGFGPRGPHVPGLEQQPHHLFVRAAHGHGQPAHFALRHIGLLGPAAQANPLRVVLEGQFALAGVAVRLRQVEAVAGVVGGCLQRGLQQSGIGQKLLACGHAQRARALAGMAKHPGLLQRLAPSTALLAGQVLMHRATPGPAAGADVDQVGEGVAHRPQALAQPVDEDLDRFRVHVLVVQLRVLRNTLEAMENAAEKAIEDVRRISASVEESNPDDDAL